MDENKKKKKALLPILLILFVILMILGGIFFLKGNKEKKEEYTIPDDFMALHMNMMEIDDEADEDGDGLTNKKEKELGTSMYSVDSDKDGLDDKTEVEHTKTNPLCADSDEDGIADGTEISAKLDPLNKKTDGQINDSDRTFETVFELEECTLTVKGKADIYDIYASSLDYCNVDNTPGIISGLYEFYMDEDKEFDSAVLEFSFDKNELEKRGHKTENLSIFQFKNDGSFEKVESKVEDGKVTATLEHFSKYVLGDASILGEEIKSEVFLLLDNSGSMYPEEQCEGSAENDVDFKRVDMAKELIQMSDEDISFGLAKFTATYTELQDGFDNKEDDLLTSLDSIKTTEENFNGTYIAKSIRDALHNFDENDNTHRKFIVLLTDGETTEGGLWDWSFYDEDNAIADANAKNVSIIVIGLGNSVDTEYLTRIANGTGGEYVYANNDDALEKVLEIIQAGLNYNMLDTDDDGENDSIMIADSGFDITKDAVQFDNYIVQFYNQDGMMEGQCFGLALLTQLYYSGKLPIQGEAVEDHNMQGFLNPYYASCKEYDLSRIEFFQQKGGNLGDYVFSEVYHELDSMPSKEKYERDEEGSKTLRYSEKARKLIESSAILNTYIYDMGGESVYAIDEKPYDSFERVYIDLQVDRETLSDEDKDAYDFILAVMNLFVHQGLDVFRSYSVQTYDFELHAQENAFHELIQDLKSGVLPITSGPGHAINAVALYRDIENPGEYILEVYDNNNHLRTKEIRYEKQKLSRFKLDATAWMNEYRYEAYDTEGIFGNEGDCVSIDFLVLNK